MGRGTAACWRPQAISCSRAMRTASSFAYRADDGERLWGFPAQTGIVAAPISFEVDGEQYVTVVAGWGGVLALGGGPVAAVAGVRNVSRVLTFKLGADGALPPLGRSAAGTRAATADRRSGACRPRQECIQIPDAVCCHGLDAVGGGVVPDLRLMSAQSHEQFYAIMLGGSA